MNNLISDTLDAVRGALAFFNSSRPVYARMLQFYGPLLEAQTTLEAEARVEPPPAADPVLAEQKTREGFPLIQASDFPIPEASASEFLLRICQMAEGAEGDMALAGKALREAISAQRLRPEALFNALLSENDGPIQEAADRLSIDGRILAVLLYQSLRPFVVACMQALSARVPDPWERGYCPVCGSLPALSLLDADGRRILVCGFCWHRWAHKRVTCPFCGNTDADQMQYFSPETEPEYRVELCDGCRGYLKTVDTRKTDRFVFPPLEALTTLHLDMKAQDMGYRNAGKPDMAS